MKTIGIDAHVITGKYQGSRTYLENLIYNIGLIDRDNRYVVYSFDPAVTRALFDFPNFRHRRIPGRNPLLRLLLFWPFAQIRDGLDFLLTQYMSPFLFRNRQMVTVHDLLFESHPQFFPLATRWRNRVLVRCSARRAHAVFTVSEFTRRALIERYGIEPRRIRMTPAAPAPVPAADHAGDPNALVRLIGPAAAEPGFRYLLFVSRIEPRKNLDALLAAFRILHRPGLWLVVVGREDFAASGTVRRMQANPAVLHLREVPCDDLAILYRRAAVLVFPSFCEGLGIPVLEALLHRIPVIASDQTAIPEAGGALARYFDPNAPDAVQELARLIAEALARPIVAEDSLLQAHLAKFDWQRSARAVVGAIGDS